MLEQHTMLKAQRLQGSRISLHLIFAFSPEREQIRLVAPGLETYCVFKSLVDETLVPSDSPVRRTGAGLFLVQVLLLLFRERILPGSEMLWESLWEPPGPKPEGTNKQHQKQRRT